LSLSGVFFSFFALYRGGTDNFIKLCGFFLIIELLLGNYPIKKIPPHHLFTAAICAYLLLASLLVPSGHAQSRQMFRLVRMLIMVFAIHCLAQKKVTDRIMHFAGATLVLSVCWQFAARYLFHLPYGTYSNPHQLAIFTALALPPIVYFFFVSKDWYKIIFVPVAIMAAALLLQTSSRPAFLAIICGTLFVVIFLSKGWHRWLSLILIFSVIAVLYITDYASVITRMKDLLVDVPKEERVMWAADSWKMLKDNSLLAWLLGNGIGSVRVFSPKYLWGSMNFPHNYFLEILFDNGIIGVVLIFGGLAFLFISTMRTIKKRSDKETCLLMKCMVAMFLIWFIHCSLTFPFYSNYSLYPLAYILGTMLVLVQKVNRDEAVVH
jgi:O-antigen ligase